MGDVAVYLRTSRGEWFSDIRFDVGAVNRIFFESISISRQLI